MKNQLKIMILKKTRQINNFALTIGKGNFFVNSILADQHKDITY